MNNKNHFKSVGQGGFTLLEILIVLIILGVLAALAIPVYSAAREKAVRQEAYQVLAATREAEMRYFSAYDTYTTSVSNLGFDPNGAQPAGVTAHYTYTIPTGDATDLLVVAARDTDVPPDSSAYSISIDETGSISG